MDNRPLDWITGQDQGHVTCHDMTNVWMTCCTGLGITWAVDLDGNVFFFTPRPGRDEVKKGEDLTWKFSMETLYYYLVQFCTRILKTPSRCGPGQFTKQSLLRIALWIHPRRSPEACYRDDSGRELNALHVVPISCQFAGQLCNENMCCNSFSAGRL